MHVHWTNRPGMDRTLQAEPQPRLVRSAQEFEGQMLKELLKPMTSCDGLESDEDGPNPDAGEVFGEFASEALGKALSEHGGFGIANRIVCQLSRSGNESATRQVTTNQHVNTAMSGHK